MAVQRFFLSILASLFLLVVPLVALAETKILTAEAAYTMGDGETPSFAEAMVLQKAKQVALEQAGTYVESYTKIQNLDLTVEEIQTIAGGVLQVKVLEKKRSLVGDGLQIYVKIKATVTTDKMEELAQRIKGKNVAEEYEKLQDDYARLIQEVESWKKLAAKVPPGLEREKALDQIKQREKTFVAVQNSEAALFRKLVSGQSLVGMADDEEAVIERLGRAIAEEGHIIKIGEATAKPIAGKKEQVLLVVPIWLKVSDRVVPQIIEAGKSLGVRIPYRSEQFRVLTNDFGAEMYNDTQLPLLKDATVANAPLTLVRLAEDLHTAQLFQDVIGALTFSLQLAGNGKTSYCLLGFQYAYAMALQTGHSKVGTGLKATEAQQFWHIIRRLFPVYEVKTGTDVIINGGYETQRSLAHMSPVKTPAPDDRGYVAIMHDEVEFKLGIVVPRDVGKSVKSIRAQIVQEAEAKKLTGQRLLCEVIK